MNNMLPNCPVFAKCWPLPPHKQKPGSHARRDEQRARRRRPDFLRDALARALRERVRRRVAAAREEDAAGIRFEEDAEPTTRSHLSRRVSNLFRS